MHDDVGARRVLHPGARTPALFALGQLHWLGQPRPQRLARVVLRHKAVGTDKTVAVERFSVAEADDVHHAVAVERVIGLQRRVQRVLGVAQVDAVQIARDFALDGDRGRRRPTRWSAVATDRSDTDGRRLRAGSTGTCRRSSTSMVMRPGSCRRRNSPWWRCCRRNSACQRFSRSRPDSRRPRR